MATRYVDPVPNATARNWGGAQGHAAGNTGTGTKNVGADYLAPYGSPLYAPIGGQIIQVFKSKYDGTEENAYERRTAVNENYGWGSSILIKGDDGYFHRLSHVVPSSIEGLKQGQRVEAGQQVAQIGQSGNTIGNGKAGGAPHLDWEKFSSKTNDPLGHDRVYEDPRAGDFEVGGQKGTSVGSSSQKVTRYAGENDARGGLNRAALSPQMQQWAGLIEEKADKYGVPPELLAGIVDYESGGKADAGHPTSGATGLGQVMPKGSGPWFNDRPTKQELLDPETNLDWSAKILAANYKKFNNSPQSAAAAYLGAVDAKGNPTTAADANGTNGFKYVQEVMGRAEKFTGTGTTGPSAASAQAASAERAASEERSMANSTKEMIDSYNKTREGINARIKATESDSKAKQEAYNKALADQATLQAKISSGAIKEGTPEYEAFGRNSLNLPNLQKAAEAAEALAKDARTDAETNDAALSKSLEIAAGKPLNPAEEDNYRASAAQANAQAAKLANDVAQMQPGQPGYDKAKAEADHARLVADNYTRTLDMQDRQIGQKDRELGQADRGLGQTDRKIGQDDRRIGLDEYEKYQTVPATVARTMAAAGLDEATAANVWARIKPGLADLEADTALKQDQARYQKAITDRTNQLIKPEFDKLVADGRLAQTAADKAVALLPSDIAAGEQGVRKGQAETGLLQGQTWAQMVDANTKQYEALLKAHEAETWQAVQKIASNPRSTDEDIIGAIQAGARNATEAAQVYQTKINQYQQQEAARHNKVDEGINIQNADETERNNRYQNLASIQNSRANMQNASTSALSGSLGASRRANELSALGMVTGSEGLNRIAMQSGAGASVVNPAIEGLKPFEKDQATLRAGVRDNRLADPNATGTAFKAPGSTAATAAAGIGSSPIPKLNGIAMPDIEGVNFKLPGAGGVKTNVGLDTSASAPAPAIPPEIANIAAPAPAPTPAPAPEPAPVPPEEEEGGGGGKPPKGGVKIMFNFKPPKAKKSTSVAASRPTKGKLGTGGGFRVPGRIAS